MVIFSTENYPVTHSVLQKLNVKSINSEGRPTVPNLTAFLKLVFPENKETFQYLVRNNFRYLLIYALFQITPIFLETMSVFFPTSCSRVALNEYLTHVFRHDWTVSQNEDIYR